jgi:hypothetical protein
MVDFARLLVRRAYIENSATKSLRAKLLTIGLSALYETYIAAVSDDSNLDAFRLTPIVVDVRTHGKLSLGNMGALSPRPMACRPV